MLLSFKIDVFLGDKPATELEESFDQDPMNDQNLLLDYKKMLETSAFSDFELKSSDDQVFNVHKSVLSVRSPVFFAMLSKEMKEIELNAVKIPNIDGVTLKELLCFIYYNRVENLSKAAEELIQAAEQYQLKDLKKQCCDYMIESLAVENVIARYQIADHIINADELFDECMNMITK